MGSKAKAPVIVMPPAAEPAAAAATAAALPPPAPQANPQVGSDMQKSSAGRRVAAGLGMNDTVLTSPMGTTSTSSANADSSRRGSLLGL